MRVFPSTLFMETKAIEYGVFSRSYSSYFLISLPLPGTGRRLNRELSGDTFLGVRKEVAQATACGEQKKANEPDQ